MFYLQLSIEIAVVSVSIGVARGPGVLGPQFKDGMSIVYDFSL